ncbi:MAG: hypothetical protein APF84_07670 [Gracilibacter sp. BRH_c7a]|nr:MAG: hypothetical protein APF84_19175 [Gracilibacter sp. BRH_c7a]KUO65104.1 MAG: hypothetical protein APF84_07670 [Gracilibacter sp. BRH_c7a]
MPGRDGTGPMGQGSMSGRGMGLCNPNSTSRNINRNGRGMGLGCRRGSGRGFFRMGYDLINQRLSPIQEKKKE